MDLSLSFHGGVGTVTGSRHLLQCHGHHYLVDAGMFQGLKALRLLNWEDPTFNIGMLKRILLTHAHLDHIGYVPRLVKQGFSGPVHCTPATAELAELILLDAAHIQEEDAEYANTKGFTKHAPAKPLFDTADAQAALGLFQPVPYDRWFDLGPGLTARFINSGHLLGSALVEMRADVGGREYGIVFSGDLGRYHVPLHVDPMSLPACDLLVLESTYGDRIHDPMPVGEQLSAAFQRTVKRGGTIVIPAFAVGRTQQIVLILRRLMESGQIPEVPIHIDSPMAIEATWIYNSHLRDHNLDDDVYIGGTSMFPRNVYIHRTAQESKALNAMRGPRVIVSASGMMSAGRILHHLANRLPDPDNLIMVVGYQAAGTRGRDLVRGASHVKIHGRQVDVEAEVIEVHGLSGHADADGLLKWVRTAPRPPAAVFIVHGEPSASDALAGRMRKEQGLHAVVPARGDTFELPPLVQCYGQEAPLPPKAQAAGILPAKEAAPARQAVLPAAAPAPTAAPPVMAGSPNYGLATADTAFMERAELRGERLLLDYQKVELALRDLGIDSTITVFGGGGILAPDAAHERLDAAQQALEAAPAQPDLQAALRHAQRVLEMSHWYSVAQELGGLLAKASPAVVATGGGPGIMEAANRGAAEAGARTLGFNIHLPRVQDPNPHITPELSFLFRYAPIRKLHLLLRARGVVAFPGGFGTLNEVSEVLALLRDGVITDLPVVLVGEAFWRRAMDVEFLAEAGLVAAAGAQPFHYAETAEEIVRHLGIA